MAYEISISKKVDNTGRSELSLRLRLGKIDQQASTHLFVNPQHVRWENYVSSKSRKPSLENISPEDRRSATYRRCKEAAG